MNELTLSNQEISTQVEVANKFPRKIDVVLDEARLMATRTKETAESCFYTLERGRTPICGPSIRLAEICTAAWGNLRIGAYIKSNDNSFITAEGWCWDVQKNLFVMKECKRSIKYENGDTYTFNMQAVTGNAACSIAQRNAIFAVIPRAFVNSVFEECKKIAVGEGNEFLTKRKETFKRLNKSGIETSTILNFFDKKSIDEFDKEDMASLIGIGNSVKDGLCTLKEAFLMNEDNVTMDVSDRISAITKNKKIIETLK